MSTIIEPICAFNDNYIWLIHDDKYAVIVDPGDAKVVISKLQDNALELLAILITHHHYDHVGGLVDLLQWQPNAVVYGPKKENIQAIHQHLEEGDKVLIQPLNLTFEVLEVHGHTSGHIAYYQAPHLFSGDTLFSVGCGRVFDGTKADLHQALQKISALPDDTLNYCAHEYTLDNIGFAKWVEPDNRALLAYEQDVLKRRNANKASIPTSLKLEKTINPFLRVNEAQVISAVEKYCKRKLTHPTEVFSELRTWKDQAYD